MHAGSGSARRWAGWVVGMGFAVGAVLAAPPRLDQCQVVGTHNSNHVAPGPVMDALIPHLRAGHLIIVSSMGSLSALYLYESALEHGIAISVASFGTTVLTARRQPLF